jgi:alkylation response protein AidB-like acyl-CoA dehydrogenase
LLSPSTERIAEVVAGLSRVDDTSWAPEFRQAFARLQQHLDLHPRAPAASATYDAAAASARALAVESLPLGLAAVMHLYPLCALRCVPLPWWSAASRRRARLLRAIHERRLVLANAGSERTAGAHEPVTVARVRGGVRIDGTYDYVSLAHVADIVLVSAPLAGSDTAVFCAADLRAPTARIGAGKFPGSMRLSDTCAVTFADHFVPTHRFIEIPTDAARECMTQYQRSWFQLLLGESYLARIEHLYQAWNLPLAPELLASLGELVHLRAYALHLLDRAIDPSAIEALARVTATMKLRISWIAQNAASIVRPFDATAAHELGFIRRQPTSDDRILASLAADRKASDMREAHQDRARKIHLSSPARETATQNTDHPRRCPASCPSAAGAPW